MPVHFQVSTPPRNKTILVTRELNNHRCRCPAARAQASLSPYSEVEACPGGGRETLGGGTNLSLVPDDSSKHGAGSDPLCGE